MTKNLKVLAMDKTEAEIIKYVEDCRVKEVNFPEKFTTLKSALIYSFYSLAMYKNVIYYNGQVLIRYAED